MKCAPSSHKWGARTLSRRRKTARAMRTAKFWRKLPAKVKKLLLRKRRSYAAAIKDTWTDLLRVLNYLIAFLWFVLSSPHRMVRSILPSSLMRRIERAGSACLAIVSCCRCLCMLPGRDNPQPLRRPKLRGRLWMSRLRRMERNERLLAECRSQKQVAERHSCKARTQSRFRPKMGLMTPSSARLRATHSSLRGQPFKEHLFDDEEVTMTTRI